MSSLRIETDLCEDDLKARVSEPGGTLDEGVTFTRSVDEGLPGSSSV